MRKIFNIISIISIIFLFISSSSAMNSAFLQLVIPYSSGTDFSEDTDCMLAAYMTNDGGNETDICQGNTLTAVSAPGTSSTVPTGYSGTSRDFVHTDADCLWHADSLDTDISGSSTDLSICVWFKLDTTVSANDANLVSKYNTTGSNRQYQFRVDNSRNGLVAWVSAPGGSVGTEVYHPTNIAASTSWHHGCLIYDDSLGSANLKIYLDGTYTTGAGNPVNFTSGLHDGSAPFIIGGLNNTCSNPFPGLIDEVIVLDRALSASEITELYETGISGNKGGDD